MSKTRKFKTYWEGSGRFKRRYKRLEKEMNQAHTNFYKKKEYQDLLDKWGFDKTNRFWDVHSHWALLNGMMGIYYAYYNDGDDVDGAIENNRVHGSSSRSEFLSAIPNDTPMVIYNYISSGGPYGDARLERVMDATIDFVDKVSKRKPRRKAAKKPKKSKRKKTAKKILTGPRGGKYYINSKGNKVRCPCL